MFLEDILWFERSFTAKSFKKALFTIYGVCKVSGVVEAAIIVNYECLAQSWIIINVLFTVPSTFSGLKTTAAKCLCFVTLYEKNS